jgi:hypothetical protein
LENYFVRFNILFVSFAFACLTGNAVLAQEYGNRNTVNTYTPNATNVYGNPYSPNTTNEDNNIYTPDVTPFPNNTLTPYITVSEEYNDNVFMDAHDKKADFITRVTPGLRLDYESPLWVWHNDAAVDYLHFARGVEGDQVNPAVNIYNHTRVIDNFFFIDVTDHYTRVPLNLGYQSLFVDQANQNFLVVSPYVRFHPKERLELILGYSYKNTIYDRADTINWQEHDVYLRAVHQLTPRSNVFGNILYAYTTTGDNYSYGRLTPSLGIEYIYADNSRIYLEGGYSLIQISGGKGSTSPFWNAGTNYSFGRWVASLNGGVSYNVDPYVNITEQQTISGGLTREFLRGALGLSLYYYTTRDLLRDSVYRKGYGLTLSGQYDFSAKLNGHLNVSVGRERGTLFINTYPFFFEQVSESLQSVPLGDVIVVESGLNYQFGHDLSLFFLDYYRSNTFSGGQSSLSNNNNRVIIGITKTFRGWKL